MRRFHLPSLSACTCCQWWWLLAVPHSSGTFGKFCGACTTVSGMMCSLDSAGSPSRTGLGHSHKAKVFSSDTSHFLPSHKSYLDVLACNSKGGVLLHRNRAITEPLGPWTHWFLNQEGRRDESKWSCVPVLSLCPIKTVLSSGSESDRSTAKMEQKRGWEAPHILSSFSSQGSSLKALGSTWAFIRQNLASMESSPAKHHDNSLVNLVPLPSSIYWWQEGRINVTPSMLPRREWCKPECLCFSSKCGSQQQEVLANPWMPGMFLWASRLLHVVAIALALWSPEPAHVQVCIETLGV